MKDLRRLSPYIRRYRKSYLAGTLNVLLTNLFTLIGPLILKRAVDDLREGTLTIPLTGYAALLIGIAVIQAIFRFAMRKIMIGASREIENDLRTTEV